jgi:hypothetical protein
MPKTRSRARENRNLRYPETRTQADAKALAAEHPVVHKHVVDRADIHDRYHQNPDEPLRCPLPAKDCPPPYELNASGEYEIMCQREYMGKNARSNLVRHMVADHVCHPPGWQIEVPSDRVVKLDGETSEEVFIFIIHAFSVTYTLHNISEPLEPD